jgi:hypothetical protein
VEHDEELLVWSCVIREEDAEHGCGEAAAGVANPNPRLSGLPLAAVAARWSEKRALHSALHELRQQRSQLSPSAL